MGANLVTLAEYKAYQGIASTNQDTQISAIIPAASQICKSYCNRSFVDYVDDVKVEVFSGGTDKLYLKEYPVLAISSVEQSTDYGQTYTSLTEFTDFALEIEDGSITVIGATKFPKMTNGFKVSYTAGYEVLPEDLRIAVLDLVAYYMKSDMAVKSQRNAGSNTTQIEYITKNTLPSHIARVFDLYIASVD